MSWYDISEGTNVQQYTGQDLITIPKSIQLSPSWKILVFGDTSPTNLFTILSGKPLNIQVITTENLPRGYIEKKSVPLEALGKVAEPRARRQVWLGNGQNNERFGYAVSWWSQEHLAIILPDKQIPIGSAITSAQLEIRRELVAVVCADTHPDFFNGFAIDESISIHKKQLLWGRYYLIYHGKVAICLVYEVFSPNIQIFGMGAMFI